MKQRKGRIKILLLSVIVAGSSVCPLMVEAGSSAIVVDEKSYQTELDTSLWNNPDEDIVLEDGLETHRLEVSPYIVEEIYLHRTAYETEEEYTLYIKSGE